MDKMTFIDLISVSFPEALLDIYIGFLLIGERKQLYLNKNNIIKLVITAFAMAVSSFCIRSFIPIKIGVITVMFHMFAYLIIIKSIYKFSFKKTILSVLLFVLTLLTIESIYLAPIAAIILKTFDKMFSDSILRFMYSIPERIIQVLWVAYLWKLNVIKVSIKKYNKFNFECNMVLYPLLILELGALFNVVNSHSLIQLGINLSFMAGLVFININLFRLITRYTEEIELRELSRINNNNIIDIIHLFLKRNQPEKAMEITKRACNK